MVVLVVVELVQELLQEEGVDTQVVHQEATTQEPAAAVEVR